MNVPNILTFLRIFLTFGFIFFALQDTLSSWIIAASLFTIASVSDFLDGYLARKYNQHTDFGKIMDPIADKFLILSAFFIFMAKHMIFGWMFYLVAAREILVTVSRLYAMKQGKVLAAEKEGKLKTVMQIVTVFLCLGVILINETPHPVSSGWYQQSTFVIEGLMVSLLMFAVVCLTLFSGIKYFWHNRKNLA